MNTFESLKLNCLSGDMHIGMQLLKSPVTLQIFSEILQLTSDIHIT